MARTPDKVLSITMTEQQLDDVYAAFNHLDLIMDFLIELTEEDVKALPKAGVINRDYIRDVLSVLRSLPAPLSPLINAQEIQKDLTLQEQLSGIVLRAEQFLKKLKDTAMLAGSEAYTTSLQVYSLIEAKANIGEPNYGALRTRLNARFALGKRKPKDETAASKDESSSQKTEAGASDDKK